MLFSTLHSKVLSKGTMFHVIVKDVRSMYVLYTLFHLHLQTLFRVISFFYIWESQFGEVKWLVQCHKTSSDTCEFEPENTIKFIWAPAL
jgi:hypothetical protein